MKSQVFFNQYHKVLACYTVYKPIGFNFWLVGNNGSHPTTIYYTLIFSKKKKKIYYTLKAGIPTRPQIFNL